jgi:enoyl-CoA hydratase
MIERELANGILILRLAHGKASTMDLELCESLRSAIEEAAANADVHALVLTGTGHIFSAGVDLKKLLEDSPDTISSFVDALDSVIRALFLFPKPAVAAINGHAIAGGAILAFACDFRMMSTGRIGVPEMLVGVPFPPMALEVVRFAVPQKHLRSMVYFGRIIDVDAAHAIGLVDDVVLPEALVIRAVETARHLADMAPDAFRMIKRQLREPYLRAAAMIAGDSADAIDEVWTSARTRERIRAYVARTLAK